MTSNRSNSIYGNNSNSEKATKSIVEALAKNATIVEAGVTLTANIKGYKVITDGSADWSFTFYGTDGTDGATVLYTPPATSEGITYGEHLTSITVGTGGEALVYI